MRTQGAKLIAHAWAHGHDRPKTSNSNVLYKSGDDTIYSYGSHFPMARHYKGVVLMTTQSYSNTTAGHMAAVRQAVSHMDVVYCTYIPDTRVNDTHTHNKNIKHWIAAIESRLISLVKARNKQPWLDKIDEQRTQARRYIELFKVKVKKADLKLLFEADITTFEAEAKKEQKAEALRKKKRIELEGKAHAIWLPLWRDGAAWDVMSKAMASIPGWNSHLKAAHLKMEHGNTTWLRTDDSNVHTSKGLTIPIDVAKRYYNKYMAVVRKGGCDNNCDYTMLDYPVKLMSADALIVGCHHIPRTEIDYIANKLKW